MKNCSQYNKECGKRLKQVRNIFAIGKKVSSEVFAEYLLETRDRIANYENGRTQIPIRLLYELHEKGFNPIYVISGDGDIFAENKEGKRIKRLIHSEAKIDTQVEKNLAKIKKAVKLQNDHENDELKAAAGRIVDF